MHQQRWRLSGPVTGWRRDHRFATVRRHCCRWPPAGSGKAHHSGKGDILPVCCCQADPAWAVQHADHKIVGQPGQDHSISEYCGVVTGEAILGANIFRDFFAGIRDVVGGRSGAYEKELRKAREIAFEELEEQAKALGANAVVGIDIDYETVGKDGSMLMVSVSGTAVIIR